MPADTSRNKTLGAPPTDHHDLAWYPSHARYTSPALTVTFVPRVNVSRVDCHLSDVATALGLRRVHAMLTLTWGEVIVEMARRFECSQHDRPACATCLTASMDDLGADTILADSGYTREDVERASDQTERESAC